MELSTNKAHFYEVKPSANIDIRRLEALAADCNMSNGSQSQIPTAAHPNHIQSCSETDSLAIKEQIKNMIGTI